MTIRLYHESDALEFEATVIAHDGDPTRVVLDRTAFYPTSGGQPHDTGLLGGVRVLDVVETADRIVHLLAGPLDLGPFQGRVDADRRLDYTVQHTAQHLVSAIAADRLGWETASVHFGVDHSTIEFATPEAGDDALRQLEAWASAAILADRPVCSGIEPAGATGLRKPSERDGPLRVVTIEGIDRSACGGTHVTSTARLGSIWIRGTERMRGRVRVVFLAGQRVLAVARSQDRVLGEIAAATGAAVEELAELVPRRLASLRVAEGRVEELEKALAAAEADRLLSASSSDPSGSRVVTDLESSRTADELRHLAQALAGRDGVRFVGSILDPPLVVVSAHPESGWHAGNLLKAALAAVGGSGGGSPLFAQGRVDSSATLTQVVALLLA